MMSVLQNVCRDAVELAATLELRRLSRIGTSEGQTADGRPHEHGEHRLSEYSGALDA